MLCFLTSIQKQMSPDETMWDPLQIGDAFSNNNAHPPIAFDFTLPDALPEHHKSHVHHQSDSYQMSTADSFFVSPSVVQQSSSCGECNELLKQLGESLDNLDKVQAENIVLKENLNNVLNRTKMLFTAQDCDIYEQELLLAFQKVKERKVMQMQMLIMRNSYKYFL
jgi:hypothetical protein